MATGLRLTAAANAITHTPVVRRLVALAGGIEPRETPLFAGETLQQWHARRRAPGGPGAARHGTVLLWPDTFTNYFHPHVGQAAVQVLEAAGWAVEMPAEPLCCGLTWISTGQLRTGKRILRRTVAQLAEHVRAGGFVVGLEPSCTTVFRSDAVDLFPDDQDVRRLRDHTVTLAELLTKHTPGWHPPKVAREVLAQVHCHQHAVLGFDAESELLKKAGAQAEPLESGCCGLAGNFGFEAGHGKVSRDLAERVLLPRLREAEPGSVVLADGFSCRTQIHELDSGGREAMHLAELLAAASGHGGGLGLDAEYPERGAAPRPAAPPAMAKLAVAGTAAALTAGFAAGAAWAVRRAMR
jgi:Fe-S oxidoreductase